MPLSAPRSPADFTHDELERVACHEARAIMRGVDRCRCALCRSYEAAEDALREGDDAHGEGCSCEGCARAKSVAAARQRARDAATHGGLSPVAHELLGPGWLGEGEQVQQQIDIEQLAQRALGSVFEQLERVGQTGREKCCPAAYAFTTAGVPLEQRLKRHEALELLRYAENALDYARVHLDYLPRDPALERFKAGDRVIVLDEESSWSGTLRARGANGTWEVNADDGQVAKVDERDLREAAQ